MAPVIGFGIAGALSTSPSISRTVTFAVGEKRTSFATGLYIVSGAARGGKSMVSRGIAKLAADANAFAGVACLYVFEPGAPEYDPKSDETTEGRFFEDPAAFLSINALGDLPTYFAAALTSELAKSDKPLLIVVDNIADPMRSFNPKSRATEAASEGGLMPSDRAFCTTLNNFATRHNIVLLGTINSDLVPFASKLDGVCQGVIQATAADSFTKHERASGRVPQSFSIPEKARDAAAASLGYGQIMQQKDSSFMEG